jgi:hypothetical protein
LQGGLATLALVGVAALIVVALLTADGLARRENDSVRGAQPKSRPVDVAPQDPTGLRLLVADLPPFVLELDRGTAKRITGLPTDGNVGLSVEPVGEHALVTSFPLCDRCRATERVYSPAAWELGRDPTRQYPGRAVPRRRRHLATPPFGRRFVHGRGSRAGRESADDQAGALPYGAGCGATRGSSRHLRGLRWSNTGSMLLRPDGSAMRLGNFDAQPVVGNLVLTGVDRSTPLLLRDVGSGARVRLRWPSKAGYGLGEVTGNPDGRFAVVEFARYSPEQRLDLWVLDTSTRSWQHLPGMPARLVAKATDVQWTADGRAVVLSGDVLRIWRPGDRWLSLRRVRPTKQTGSSFVVW